MGQVWAADITYLPMRRGFLYLVTIMDWHTRKVLAWRISNALEADFCVEALNEAIHRLDPLEIMNSPSRDIAFAMPCRAVDQGSQFTSFAWTDRLRRSDVRISLSAIGRNRLSAMDGRQGTVPRQHLRGTALAEPEPEVREVKYECVYLHAWETGSEARAGVGKWIEFYNHKRPHSALGGKPPAVVHWLRKEDPP